MQCASWGLRFNEWLWALSCRPSCLNLSYKAQIGTWEHPLGPSLSSISSFFFFFSFFQYICILSVQNISSTCHPVKFPLFELFYLRERKAKGEKRLLTFFEGVLIKCVFLSYFIITYSFILNGVLIKCVFLPYFILTYSLIFNGF